MFWGHHEGVNGGDNGLVGMNEERRDGFRYCSGNKIRTLYVYVAVIGG